MPVSSVGRHAPARLRCLEWERGGATDARPRRIRNGSAVLLQRFLRRGVGIGQQRNQVARLGGHGHARLAEGGLLALGRTLAAAHDGAGVAHPLARRRGATGDEAHHRDVHVLLDVLGGLLLVVATDLTDQDRRLGVGVGLEGLEAVDEVRADDRIAADADTGALTQPTARELVDDLVGERAAAADHAHLALAADVTRQDTDLRLARADQAGAVRADQTRATLLDEGVGGHHVVHRKALGDAYDELDPGVDGLVDRVDGEGRRHEDAADVRAGLLDRVADGVEHGNAHMLLATLARRHATDQVASVLLHLPGVESAVAASDPLDDDPAALVGEDAHCAPPASSRAFCTASSMVTAGCSSLPSSILRPSSSFVPVRRTTIGTLTSIISLAFSSPAATSSQRVIPPKMLNRIAFTLSSRRMIFMAVTTFSGLLLPPMSRKFAGLPPKCWTRSMVAMANPAPLT